MRIGSWITLFTIIGTALTIYSLVTIKPKHQTATTKQRLITLMGILLVVFALGMAVGSEFS
ncbi:hypothetical protein [Weissella halotolerans]|uniref:Uncharacterized protein n=1 Tax=Weissella halotolerans DSM 20190 TaxID=1123500 RepID=A0A0R2FYB8_9LACO|nr:hypothetical protein [Weissella halotolerans]KRN33455.1 hypothetical protein IV68_GL000257 [Weissella halotolerans DSM 20190]